MKRAEGHRRCLREAGCYDPALEWLHPAPSSMALGAEMLGRIMAAPQPPEAIFFCNDDMAQGALLEAMRRGVRVPGQVAIAGFNDLPGSRHMVPPLTSLRTPRGEVGTAAASMLIEPMRNRPVEASCIDLPYELMMRGSTVAGSAGR